MDILIKKNELIKLEGSGEPERKLFITKKIHKHGFMIYVKTSEWLKKKKYAHWKLNINAFLEKFGSLAHIKIIFLSLHNFQIHILLCYSNISLTEINVFYINQ